jgi:hypothetical protein
VRCGICGTRLHSNGTSRSGRLSPVYAPCPRLQDAAAHPARAKAIAEAEAKSAAYLGDSNEHREAGRTDAADRCLARAQRWLDKANDLRGQGS